MDFVEYTMVFFSVYLKEKDGKIFWKISLRNLEKKIDATLPTVTYWHLESTYSISILLLPWKSINFQYVLVLIAAPLFI